MDVEEPAPPGIPPSPPGAGVRARPGEVQVASRRLPSISALLNATDSPPPGATDHPSQTFAHRDGFHRGEQPSSLPPSPSTRPTRHRPHPAVHTSSTERAADAGLAYSARHPPDPPSPPPPRQLTSLEFPDGNALRPLPSGLSSYNGRGRSASIPHLYGFDESRQGRFSGFATSSERHDDSVGSDREASSAGGISGDFGMPWPLRDPRDDPSRPRALSISTADELRTRAWVTGPHQVERYGVGSSREREGRYGTVDSTASLSRVPPYYRPQTGPPSYPNEPFHPPRYPYDAYVRPVPVVPPYTGPYPPYAPSAAPPPIPLSIPSAPSTASPVSPPPPGPTAAAVPPPTFSPVGPPPASSWTPPTPAPAPAPAPAPLATTSGSDDGASASEAQNVVETPGDVGRYACPHCPKRFARPSSLRIHMHSHTGEKPFTCPLCDRAFSVQSNLRRHLKIHKGGEAKVGPSRRGGSTGSASTPAPTAGSSRSTMPSVLAEEDEGASVQPPSRPASAEGNSGSMGGTDGDEGDAEGSIASASTTSAPGEATIAASTHPPRGDGPPPLVRTEWPRLREQAD